MPLRLIRARNMPRLYVLSLGLLVLVLLGLVDWLTGPYVSLLVFYFIPVCVFAWHLGKRAGILAAAACTIAWLPGVIHSAYEGKQHAFANPALTVFWNEIIRFCSLTVVAFLVDACKRLTERVEKLVAERTAALEDELNAQRRAEEQIRQLTAQLNAAESDQRRALAQELHDSLGQDLSALKLGLQSVLVDANRPGSERVKNALTIVDGLIRRTRTMTFELHPAMLEDLGLGPTLQRFAEGFTAQTSVTVEIVEAGERRDLASAVGASLFRAVKELVLNAAKHGKAREVTVSIFWQAASLRIVVDDDGEGFVIPPTAAQANGHHGLGLAWIQERLRIMGGSFLAESSPDGHGTRVILEIALTPHAAPAASEIVV